MIVFTFQGNVKVGAQISMRCRENEEDNCRSHVLETEHEGCP